MAQGPFIHDGIGNEGALFQNKRMNEVEPFFLLIIACQERKENNPYHIFDRMPYIGMLAGNGKLTCLFQILFHEDPVQVFYPKSSYFFKRNVNVF